jgi:hypothetical protein
LHGYSDEHSWRAMQCGQGAKISATKHLDFLSEICTNIIFNWFT